jgi:hypothetical protein
LVVPNVVDEERRTIRPPWRLVPIEVVVDTVVSVPFNTLNHSQDERTLPARIGDGETSVQPEGVVADAEPEFVPAQKNAISPDCTPAGILMEILEPVVDGAYPTDATTVTIIEKPHRQPKWTPVGRLV